MKDGKEVNSIDLKEFMALDFATAEANNPDKVVRENERNEKGNIAASKCSAQASFESRRLCLVGYIERRNGSIPQNSEGSQTLEWRRMTGARRGLWKG
jgi:hypothetical protein